MELVGKPDWDKARQRMEAWWAGEVIDRVCIKVTAPLEPAEPEPEDLSPEQLQRYWFDPDLVIPRCEESIARTWWGGEAFPVMLPMSGTFPAITAAYLGCPARVSDVQTAWCDHIIDDWQDCPDLTFDAENEWYRRTVTLLRAAGERAQGCYYIAIPDLNGPGEILARLRGSENLAVDLIENPDRVHAVMKRVNRAWLAYWQSLMDVVHEHVEGYLYWMRIWSDLPATDLQTDFSIMISSAMFDEFFIPYIEEQTRWVGRTIYHLDGPGAARHLDSLLELPRLNGRIHIASATGRSQKTSAGVR